MQRDVRMVAMATVNVYKMPLVTTTGTADVQVDGKERAVVSQLKHNAMMEETMTMVINLS